jgi:hypothetical protein
MIHLHETAAFIKGSHVHPQGGIPLNGKTETTTHFPPMESPKGFNLSCGIGETLTQMPGMGWRRRPPYIALHIGSFQEPLGITIVSAQKKTGFPRLSLGQGNPVNMLPIDFGNPAIPVGPVAFRPPIARSLALSVVSGGPYEQPSLIKGLPLFKVFSEVDEESFRKFFDSLPFGPHDRNSARTIE